RDSSVTGVQTCALPIYSRPPAHQQEVGNARGRCVVCRAEVRHEDVTVDEALAVEVADVRRAVDGHGARDEVVMAPAEVVRPLVRSEERRVGEGGTTGVG